MQWADRWRGTQRIVTGQAMGLIVAAVALAVLGAFVWPALRSDWFFDEAWRADMIRTPWSFERYRLHDTPIPPGWLVGNWTVFEVLPSRRPVIRVVAHLPVVLTTWLLYDLLARTLSASRSDGGEAASTGRARLVAAATVVLLLLTPAMAAPITYLNNYTVDLLVAVALVWGCRAITDGDVRRGTVAVVVAGALAPLIAQGGALVLPAILVVLVLRSRVDGTPRWLRLVPIGTAALAAVGGAVVALTLYLPVARDGSVDDFWASESLAGLGLLGWIPRWWTTFAAAALPTWLHGQALASLVLGAATIVGLVVLWRRFALAVIAPVTAQAAALVTAVVTGWPVTVVRVNLAFQAFFVLAAVLGAVVGTIAVVDRAGRALAGRRDRPEVPVTSSPRRVVIATAGFAMAFAAMWPGQVLRFSTSQDVFARGLSDDLTEIAAMSAPGDVVIGFHHMSSWYLHDVLVTSAAAPGLVVLDELEHGPEIVDDPVATIAALAPTARRVWCVLPFELGPEGTFERCLLEPTWEVAQEFRLRRVTVVEAVSWETR